MNKIIYAGDIQSASGLRSGNCFNIIIPAEKGNGGSVLWEKNGCKNQIAFPAGCIIAVPPAFNYNLTLNQPQGTLYLLIERALLPFKDITLLKDDENRTVTFEARQAAKYFSGNAAKKDLILSALGALIVSYITNLSATDDYSPVTRQIRADLEKNISNSAFSLEDYLKNLPLSYDYVRKVFKKETGVTPHEYLLRQRMEFAAQLLSSGISNKYSAYSVSQVAEACGFPDPLYFSKVFKKYYGVAPGGYGK